MGWRAKKPSYTLGPYRTLVRPPPPAPPIPLEPGERLAGEWMVPFESAGVESVTRFFLTDRRLVVQCVFTRAGWMAGRKQRELVNLGQWQDLLISPLQELDEPSMGTQRAGMVSLRPLVIAGKPLIMVNDQNRLTVEAILARLAQVKAAQTPGPSSADSEPPGAPS